MLRVTQAIFTIAEVKGWSLYTCFPKERNKYKGQLVLLADLVGGREEAQRLLGYSCSNTASGWGLLQNIALEFPMFG